MPKKKKIAIIGAGFTGLTAALRLSQKGFLVEIFEVEDKPGGLAIGVSLENFPWSIEKHYHHLFTNDYAIINLMKEIGLEEKLIYPKSLTSVFYKDRIYPFNTPSQILNFTPLPLIDRIRLGAVSAYLKILPVQNGIGLERYRTVDWIKKYYGEKTFSLVWEPLLSGKFGRFKNYVNMAWFWARIKKRTFTLGYIAGGFQTLAVALDQKIKSLGGKIHYNTAFTEKDKNKFDKIIVTAPTPVFTKIFSDLPRRYTDKLEAIPHLHALNLLLILEKQFFPDKTYWLNINESNFPFIAVVEHTNFIDPKYYGGKHLVYIGNYLPSDHPYLQMSKEELLKVYMPYLRILNSKFRILNSYSFFGPFAQPVFPLNYSQKIPDFRTPLPDVFLANLDMVYPWDRGTNYAVELGEKIAKCIQ